VYYALKLMNASIMSPIYMGLSYYARNNLSDII